MNYELWFHHMCQATSMKSPCLSRNIGAIIVRDNSIVSTGYNGPPRGIPHCGYERAIKDPKLNQIICTAGLHYDEFGNKCPRKALDFASGTHMELCPAQHAEENAVSNAAKLGVSIDGCTLYMNSVISCQKCFGTLINAGIVELVVENAQAYDEYTQFLITNSKIKIREFKLN